MGENCDNIRCGKGAVWRIELLNDTMGPTGVLLNIVNDRVGLSSHLNKPIYDGTKPKNIYFLCSDHYQNPALTKMFLEHLQSRTFDFVDEEYVYRSPSTWESFKEMESSEYVETEEMRTKRTRDIINSIIYGDGRVLW